MRCTAAHLRSRSLNIVSLSDMIEGSYRSWDLYTTGQLEDGLQQKRKSVFIKQKWNHVFSRVTILSFHSVYTLVFQEFVLSILTHRDNTHSLTFWLPALNNPRKCIHSATFFFFVRPFRLDLLQARTQQQKFRQTTERNKQSTWSETRSSEHT